MKAHLKTRLPAAVVLILVLLPAAAPAAVDAHAGGAGGPIVHSQPGGFTAIKYGLLPVAREGKPYSFSIAGAAIGGVKPYHCAPAEPFGPVWAWLHVGSNCLLTGTAPILGPGVSQRQTVFTFRLTDSENPPKTVTSYPISFEIISHSFEYPFDGTWRIKQTVTATITCAGAPAITKTITATNEVKVVHGVAGGQKLSVDVSGITGTVTRVTTVQGVTFNERYEFSVTGAATSVRVTGSGSGTVASCTLKEHGTGSGSRISP